MKKIFIAAIALLPFCSTTFAQGRNSPPVRPYPESNGWNPRDRSFEDNRWNEQGRYEDYQRVSYVRSHPAYRSLTAARIPLREARRVEGELRRIEQMEWNFARNGRLGLRERALLDRELAHLDTRVTRYYQRGYAGR